MAEGVLFSGSGNPTDEQLLVAALSGSQRAWTYLTQRFHPYLTKVVRRRAGDLPADLQGEIINEVWGAVFRAGPQRFHPLTDTARSYIGSFVKDASERVRAAYRAPGQRSRARDARRSRAESTGPLSRVDVRLVSIEELREDQQPGDPRQEAAWEQLLARIDVDRARAVAATPVALAIDLAQQCGTNYAEAALMVGLTRVSLLRRLAHLRRRLRAG